MPPSATQRARRAVADGKHVGILGDTMEHAQEKAAQRAVDAPANIDQRLAQMGEVMQEVGGDGFLFALPNVSRKSVMEVTNGLVPALQQRGLVRKQYGCEHFRDNLLEF